MKPVDGPRSELMHDELDRVRKEQSLLARAARHDLLAPARQIEAFADLARDSVARGESHDADECLGFVITAARRMQGLVFALDEYLRIEEQPPEFQNLELGHLVDAAFATARTAAPASATFVRDDLPSALADRAQLRRVLDHLLSNAVKYRRSEPLQVHVRGGANANEYWISVTDNGGGIAADLVERAFEPLRRLVPKDAVDGSGLGLPTCRRILAAHGGSVSVESEVGRGSTFYVRWPADLEC